MKLENKQALAHYAGAAVLVLFAYFGLPLLLAGRELSLIALYLVNAVQQILLYALPALLILHARDTRWQRFKGLMRPVGVDTLGYCMLGAVACTVVVLLVVALWMPVVEKLLGYVPENPPLPHPANAVEWLASMIAVAVIPALAEEVFFRGFLQTAVERFFPRAGVWLVAAVFAALHLDLVSLPGLFVAGLVLGKLKNKRGLSASMIFHGLYNSVVLLLNFKNAQISALGLWLCLFAFFFSVRRLMREEDNHAADGTGM